MALGRMTSCRVEVPTYSPLGGALAEQSREDSDAETSSSEISDDNAWE